MTLDFGWNSKKFRISGAKQKKEKKKIKQPSKQKPPMTPCYCIHSLHLKHYYNKLAMQNHPSM